MTDTYTAPFMLRMFKAMPGILPWLLAVLSMWCWSLSAHTDEGSQCEGSTPFTAALGRSCGCLTWLVCINVRYRVTVFICHAMGNSNGRDHASLGWGACSNVTGTSPHPPDSKSQQLHPPAHPCCPRCYRDPDSSVWRGKWHGLYAYFGPTGLT